MPSFRDPDGSVWIWDSSSKSYVKSVKHDQRPDISHATGGDNDLFDPFQHSEQVGVPELEGYMASKLGWADTEWAPQGKVICPNCQEVTDSHVCPMCGKDLTPEWNNEDQRNNEFMDVMPEHSDATDAQSWPQRVPKRNREKTDDSYPSMTLSSVYAFAQKIAHRKLSEEDWDTIFEGKSPMRTEIGKWLIDKQGQMHYWQGMDALHERIAQRDGLNYPADVGALGSVYNDGTADVQKVYPGFQFNQESAQQQIEQAFGPVTLQAPVGQGATEAPSMFEPFEIREGTWVIPPQIQGQPITGVAWVKERPQGQSYQPNMILVAEHLQPGDFMLWSKGVTAIITAVGGMASHAAYLASTQGIPVVVGIGDAYNKIPTGSYVKIEPSTQTITVMPGANGSMSPEEKQNVWNSILQYQYQRGGSVKPVFAHVDEELAWKESSGATLDSCPECGDPMVDKDGEMVCHSCGHKQAIIHHNAKSSLDDLVDKLAGALAIPALAEGAGELLGGGAAAGAAGGAAGASGIGGIGSLMNSALGRGVAFRAGENMVGGGQGAAPGGAAAGGDTFDPGGENAGVISSKQSGVLTTILESVLNALKQAPEALVDPKNPLSYADDIASGAIGAGQAGAQQQSFASAGTTFGEDEVGSAAKNRGDNSDPDKASNSGIEGKEEQGDGPEQLKDVDGEGGPKDSAPADDLGNQGDPHMQDKALKAFHMNLPLVIEFANSDEPGIDNPILQALDSLLEEAFPGYKDGTDPNGAEDEHPVEEITEKIETSDGSPEHAGDNEDKKDSKEASVWHFADFEDALADLPPVTSEQDPEAETPLGDMRWLDSFPHEGGTNAVYPAMAQPGMGAPDAVNPGAQAPCPMCGCVHAPGQPCPQYNNTQAPAATGAPITPPAPNTVVTKWQVVSVGWAPDQPVEPTPRSPLAPAMLGEQQQQDDMSPGDVIAAYPDGTIVLDDGITTYNMQRAQEFAAQHGWSQDQSDAHFAFYTAADEHQHEHHHHEVEQQHKPDPLDQDLDEASSPWVDTNGESLVEGAQYEMKSPNYEIPDRVTIDRVLPDKLVYTIHSGDVDFSDTVDKDQLALDGTQFLPVDMDDTQADSEGGFPTDEAPIRPGQDALPQQDDLSTPATVVSSTEEFEPVGLENYTGSFKGDAPNDRSWLMESSGGSVEVDPALMAKLAGKDFTPREQREFIEESGTARNLDRLSLEGTHYVLDSTDDQFNWI